MVAPLRIELRTIDSKSIVFPFKLQGNLVRDKGIEPLTQVWKTRIMPFN